MDNKENTEIIAEHFSGLLNENETSYVEPFEKSPRSLNLPISTEETNLAIIKLNNNRAARPDNIHGEMIKYAPGELITLNTKIFNKVFETHSPLKLGDGILIPLHKPEKSKGPIKI